MVPDMSDHTVLHRHLWPGVPLAIISAVLFGMSTPVSKILLGVGMDPQLLAGFLYLGAGIGLALLYIGRAALGRPSSETPLRRTDAPWLAAIILCGGLAAPLLLMLGLAETSAASGSLLLNLEGLATMGIAWLVFHENVDLRLLLGAFAILNGSVLLSWQGQSISLDRGSLLIAAACLCWGIDNNLTRKLSSAAPMQITLIKGLAAGGVNMGLALLRGAALPSTGLLGIAGIAGFLGVGVSLVLFVRALRHLGAARTAAYFSLAPFIGALLSVLLLAEPLTAQLAAAAVLMGVGLWLHLTEKHEHQHVHEMMEHEHSHVHDAHHHHDHAGAVTEPHTHWHRHEGIQHRHVHYPDLHHRHGHG